jgi:hypothetical protein
MTAFVKKFQALSLVLLVLLTTIFTTAQTRQPKFTGGYIEYRSPWTITQSPVSLSCERPSPLIQWRRTMDLDALIGSARDLGRNMGWSNSSSSPARVRQTTSQLRARRSR